MLLDEKRTLKRFAIIGASLGIALLVAGLGIMFSGSGVAGDRAESVAYLIAILGTPFNIPVIVLLSSKNSPLLGLQIPLLILSIVVQWAFLGWGVGWIVVRIRRIRRRSK